MKGPSSWMMCSVSGSALAVLFVYSQSTSPSAWETLLSPALAFPWANVSKSVRRLHELIDYDVCKTECFELFLCCAFLSSSYGLVNKLAISPLLCINYVL